MVWPAFVRNNEGRRARAALAALCLFLAGGCVHLEQEIRINRNGAGTVKYHYSVAAELVEALANGQRTIEKWQGLSPGTDPAGLNWFLSKSAAEQHFSGSGITLERYRTLEKGGRRHVWVTVFVKDMRRGLGTGKFGSFSLKRVEDGEVLFAADLAPEGAGAPLSVEELSRLRELCSDLRLALTVKAPSRIMTTSAPAFSGTSATWVFDPAEDVSCLRRPPVIDLRFSADGRRWP